MTKFLAIIGLIVIVGPIAYLIYSFDKYKSEASKMIKEAYQVSRDAEVKRLTEELSQLKTSQARLNTQLVKKNQQTQKIKSGMGSSIREFNENVRELKNVKTARESIEHLYVAWDWTSKFK